MERWPSGLRRTPGKRVHRKVSGVRIPVSPPEPTTNYARVSGRFHVKKRGTKRSFGDGQLSRKAGHPQGGQVVRCEFCAAPSGMRRLDATSRPVLRNAKRELTHGQTVSHVRLIFRVFLSRNKIQFGSCGTIGTEQTGQIFGITLPVWRAFFVPTCRTLAGLKVYFAAYEILIARRSPLTVLAFNSFIESCG